MINTRKIATEYRLSHWAQIIRERQESGLSIKTYCKQAGFHENRFFYWQRRVFRAACEQLTENSHETTPIIQAINNFTEVKLLPTPERFPLSQATMLFADKRFIPVPGGVNGAGIIISQDIIDPG